MFSIGHDVCRGPRARARRPCPRNAARLAPLAVRNQPQGHRYAVPAVLVHDAAAGRRDGADDPRRAVRAGSADHAPRVLQPVDHHARPDHGVRRDHAGLRRLRELDDAAADRRLGHGLRAHEQLSASGCCRSRLLLLVGSFFAPGGATAARLDALRAALHADGPRHGLRHFRGPPDGRLVDHGRRSTSS